MLMVRNIKKPDESRNTGKLSGASFGKNINPIFW